MFKHIKNRRIGSRLEDGKAAHTADHNQWSRRQFLSNTSMMAAGGMLFGSSPLLSWASPLMASLYDNPDNDRVLILVRLKGGNDGLNTIVPISDGKLERYLDLRKNNTSLFDGNMTPTVANYVNPLIDNESQQNFALPKLFKNAQEDTDLLNLWEAGNMSVIHSVGYPNQNRSHFTGSDFWANCAANNTSAQDERQYSGWMGRYFDKTLPAFLSAPPTIPPAIQIGSSSNLIFRGATGSPYDLIFSDLEAFDAVIQNGSLYGDGNFSNDCIAEMERVFVRQVADSTFRYGKAVQKAYYKSKTASCAGYQSENGLADQLEVVSRLIKGKLGTKIYMVTLGNFDTHAAQMDTHKELLQKLSNAIGSTFRDLAETGDDERVMMMTFSEFGRTVKDNSSKGTDHGTLAPVMLFGKSVEQGGALAGRKHYGTGMTLDADRIDKWHSVHFEAQPGAIDFRTIYDKVLRDWLCADAQTADDTLNYNVNQTQRDNPQYISSNDPQPYPRCSQGDATGVGEDNNIFSNQEFTKCDSDPLGGMILGGCNSTVSQSSSLDAHIASLVTFGYNVKSDDDTVIEFKYSTKTPANVKLEISGPGYVNQNPLVERYHEAGSYTYEFSNEDLTQGTYRCRLEVNGMVVERTLVIH